MYLVPQYGGGIVRHLNKMALRRYPMHGKLQLNGS
jgi:hypothetical protein